MSSINPNEDARIRQNREDARAAFSQTDRERTPEEIEADIRTTRSEMDGTLSQLQRRLSSAPNEMVGDFTESFKQAVVRNPVPAALIAAGLVVVAGSTLLRHRVPLALVGSAVAWRKMYGPEEMYQRGYREASRHQDRIGYGDTSASPYYETGQAMDYPRRQRSSRPGMVDRLKDMASSSRERLSETSHQLAERSSHMREQLSDVASRGRSRASYMSDRARGQARRARSGYDSMLREQPLMLGLMGMAVGAAIGALAPMTRRENRLMGEASDHLTERAREEMHHQLDKGKRVAEAATEAATEAAKEEAHRQQERPSDTRGPTPGL